MGNTTPEVISSTGQLFYFLVAAGGASVLALFIGATYKRFFSFFAGAVWLLFTYYQMATFDVDSPHWYMGWLGVVAAIFFFYSSFAEQKPKLSDEDEEDEDFDEWQRRREAIMRERRKQRRGEE